MKSRGRVCLDYSFRHLMNCNNYKFQKSGNVRHFIQRHILCGLVLLLGTTSYSMAVDMNMPTMPVHASSNQYALVKEKVGLGGGAQFEVSIPQSVEFKRINPTKYRVELHHVRDNFNLVFNERYDKQWKAYVVPKRVDNLSSQQLLSNTLCMTHEGTHGLAANLNQAMIIDPNRNISIENEKLASSYFWETWLSHNLAESEKNSFDASTNTKLFDSFDKARFVEYFWLRSVEWPEAFHGSANMFANGWLFDLSVICSLPKSKDITMGYYIENTDGSIDIDLVFEYKPQRYVYLAYMLSIASIILSLVMLILLRKSV